MNKGQMNLQDLFLNQVRKENIPVTIYLIGGVQLKGMVRGFDAFTVLLDSQGKPLQLVYKHAIASVVPGRPVGNLYRDEMPTRERDEMPSREREEAPARERTAQEAEAAVEE